MTPFQFGKMGFYGHVLKFSSVRLVPDRKHITPETPYSEAGFYAAKQQSSPLITAQPLLNGKESQARLEPEAAKPDNNGRCWAAGYQSLVAMNKEEERELQQQLARLQQEHRDLDAAISALQHTPGSDQLQVQRLKKRKLQLRDRISYIEDQLTPDIIA